MRGSVYGRLAAGALLLLALLRPNLLAAGPLRAEIVRTPYGVVHVRAKSYASLGFGEGYAYAEDNVCLLADQVVTVSGERSRWFGGEAMTQVSFVDIKNLDADLYFRTSLDGAALLQAVKTTTPENRALLQGYAAGYNRYLKDRGPGGLPEPCRGAPWVRPLGLVDVLKLAEEKMTGHGVGAWAGAVTAAAPPEGAPSARAVAAAGRGEDLAALSADLEGLAYGSNGWAFGRAATGGSGVLLGNPHFPWTTTNRFYQVHLTIPGRLDVMGVSGSSLPAVVIGFNRDVAWTHTVSTDRHFTLYELTLDPNDPLTYLVDGQPHRLERRTARIPQKEGPPVTRTVYWSLYGPVVSRPALGVRWTRAKAYAFKDANRLNVHADDAWLAIARARTVEDVRRAISARSAIPWVNTIAADRAGHALYADVTATPNLSAAALTACVVSTTEVAALRYLRLYVLDGARGACAWPTDPASREPGLMPPDRMPSLIREDFVANSNDSYWLANDAEPLRGFSPIIGGIREPQSLRTRQGLLAIHAALAGGGLITPERVKAMVFSERNMAAELVLDDALSLCAGWSASDADLGAGCSVLKGWDRRMGLESKGALVFVELWSNLVRDAALWRRPFDPDAPLKTPFGLRTDPKAAETIRLALKAAIGRIRQRGLPLDAPWGAVQAKVAGRDLIPIPGGPNIDGVLDAEEARFDQAAKVFEPYSGSSYVQVVAFDAKGPRADAVLTYSQSTDPASPFASDQTRLFSRGGWNRLPFAWSAVERAAISRVILSERGPAPP